MELIEQYNTFIRIIMKIEKDFSRWIKHRKAKMRLMPIDYLECYQKYSVGNYGLS